ITTGGSIARSAFRCSVISTRLSRAGRDGNTSGSNAGNEHRCTGWEASRDGTPICSSCGSSACDRRLEGRSRMRREFHVRFCEGGRVRFPSATRPIVGFEHGHEAEQFLANLKARLARFGLTLHPDKTRLIEFGRQAIASRRARGLGKPESFDFLGFTHFCATRRDGSGYVLGRKPVRKRMRAKLREIKGRLQAMRHDGIERQGRWLAQVLRGWLAYYAVPMSAAAITAFRHHMIERWFRVLQRRSQRTRRSLSWGRMKQIAERYLPYPRILHPWPEQRFLVTIQGKSPVR